MTVNTIPSQMLYYNIVLHVPVMYRDMVYNDYVTVLHLTGSSVNSHFSIRVRVRAWHYFTFRDRYMK